MVINLFLKHLYIYILIRTAKLFVFKTFSTDVSGVRNDRPMKLYFFPSRISVIFGYMIFEHSLLECFGKNRPLVTLFYILIIHFLFSTT